jgi:hypothetical protein
VPTEEILLDFSKTDEIGTTVKNSKIIIKVSSNKELVFSGDQLNLETISTKKESESILYTLRIDRSNLPHAKIKYD